MKLLYSHIAQAIAAAQDLMQLNYVCGLLDMAHLLRALSDDEVAALQKELATIYQKLKTE